LASRAGKNSIVEDLFAARLRRRPEILRTSGCLADLGWMLAGAKYRASSKSGLAVLGKSKSPTGQIVLFMDELPRWSAGAAEEPSTPATAGSRRCSGELRAIGAATLNEYRK
jgi:ATP-dependent Clp protease ATP-binding subunit ClpA